MESTLQVDMNVRSSVRQTKSRTVQHPQPVSIMEYRPSQVLTRLQEEAAVDDSAPEIIELLQIADNTAQVRCDVPIDEPIFRPTPSKVVFKRFNKLDKLQAIVKFRNSDRVARRLKVQAPDASFLKISGPTAANGKPIRDGRVAPGMQIQYVISFNPQEVKDYQYDVICVTEREKFILPVRAIGSRAFLNFPDVITLNATMVHSEITKSIVVSCFFPFSFDVCVPHT